MLKTVCSNIFMMVNWRNLSEMQFSNMYQNVELFSLIIPMQETYPGAM